MSLLLRTDTQKKLAGLLFGSGFILYTGFNAKGLEKLKTIPALGGTSVYTCLYKVPAGEIPVTGRPAFFGKIKIPGLSI